MERYQLFGVYIWNLELRYEIQIIEFRYKIYVGIEIERKFLNLYL